MTRALNATPEEQERLRRAAESPPALSPAAEPRADRVRGTAVTAPGGGGADEIREELADWTGAWTQAERDDLLDVVRALIAKGAAAELRAMGRAALRTTPGAAPVTVPVGDLFERAEALDPTLDGAP